jgi:hypothetical protein
LVLFTKTIFAKFNSIKSDTINPIEIVKDQVIYENKTVAKIKSEKISATDSKNVRYLVNVYESEGKQIAKFEIEVTQKAKKNVDAVKYAQLTTLKDNVVHNGSNFIDFHLQLTEAVLKEDEAPQLANMVDYLIDNKYIIIEP